jgi:predicted DsbA family dithiol-disulfide isomerase
MAEWLRRRFGVGIVWLPFDLHPEYPAEGIPRAQLHARYRELVTDHVRAMFEREGLAYAPPPDLVPNTMDALRLTELARDRGLHEPMHDRLMDAYWKESRNIGDDDVLRALAAEVGIEREDADRVLASDEYHDRVLASTAQAQAIGINGIPAFLLDERLLVLGAQPREVFERAFEQLERTA